jgi:hypothetical protein
VRIFAGSSGAGGVVGGGTGLAGPAALGVLAGGEVGFDDIADEIGCGGGFRLVGAAHGKTSLRNRAILPVGIMNPIKFTGCRPCTTSPP